LFNCVVCYCVDTCSCAQQNTSNFSKMSSFKNAFKSSKTHRERHQPAARAHLGFLEKKQDYTARAKDFNEKKDALKLLHKRALNRNPDEFYFHMVRSRMEDGDHVEKPKEEECTPEQLKLMQTQDLKYIAHKRNVEAKKIEKLQSELHLIDTEKSNTHTFFVDSKDDAKSFDVADRLETHPSLLNRTHNRPRLEDLKDLNLTKLASSIAEDGDSAKAYRLLEKRIGREKQLLVAQQKMEVKMMLQNKKLAKPKRIAAGSKTSAPVYKWKTERKR